MSLKIILADTQIIFRAGVARTLSLEHDCEVVAQCATESALRLALPQSPASIVLFAESLTPNPLALAADIRAMQSHSILVLEHGHIDRAELQASVDGMVPRSVTALALVDCIRRVAVGNHCVHPVTDAPPVAVDQAEALVLRRLTPKEMQIIALIAAGCKNREIAHQLGTKEQVIKNYLRSIYEKTGVADRLELALYTVYHKTLARAIVEVRASLERRV